MAKIKNLTDQLEVIGTKDGFNDSIAFYKKRDVNDAVRLGVSSNEGKIILSTVSAVGEKITSLETFDYSDITEPLSLNISGLVEVVNGYLNSPLQESLTDAIIGDIVTPPALTADVDDYEPDGFVSIGIIRQDLDANNRSISGFPAPEENDSRIIGVCNISTSGFDLKFFHNDSGSIDINRLLLRDDANKSIKPNETAWFWYDHIVNRWRPYNRIG